MAESLRGELSRQGLTITQKSPSALCKPTQLGQCPPPPEGAICLTLALSLPCVSLSHSHVLRAWSSSGGADGGGGTFPKQGKGEEVRPLEDMS